MIRKGFVKTFEGWINLKFIHSIKVSEHDFPTKEDYSSPSFFVEAIFTVKDYNKLLGGEENDAYN